MAWNRYGQWVDDDKLQGMLYQNPLASLGGSAFTGPLSTLTQQATGNSTGIPSVFGGSFRASPAHFAASQDIENQAATGNISAQEADFSKARNLIGTGFNTPLAAAGAYPYQIGQEVLRDVRDQGISGVGSGLARGAKAGFNNLRGIGAGIYDRLHGEEAPQTSSLTPFTSQALSLPGRTPQARVPVGEQPVSPVTDQDYIDQGTIPTGTPIGSNINQSNAFLADEYRASTPSMIGLGTGWDQTDASGIFGTPTYVGSTTTDNQGDVMPDLAGNIDLPAAFEMFRPGEDLGMVDPTWADSGGWGVPQETVSLPEILSYAAPLPALGLLGKIPAVGKALTSAEKAMRRNLLKGAAGVAALGAAGRLGPGAINRALDLAKSGGVETFKDIGVKTVSVLDEFGKTIGFKNVISKGAKKGQKLDPTLKDNIQVRSKKGTDKTPYDWAGAPIGASVAEIVSNAKTAPTGNLERIAARRSSELARQQQAAADKRAADRLAAQQAQEAAAQAQAASAAQAQAAQNAARAVLASAAGRDRGGPSSREIAAAIEVLSGVDSFGSGGMRNTRGEVGMDETGYTDTSGYGVG